MISSFLLSDNIQIFEYNLKPSGVFVFATTPAPDPVLNTVTFKDDGALFSLPDVS